MDKPLPLTWAIEVAGIGQRPLEKSFVATADERSTLAGYLGVASVPNLRTDVRVSALSRGRFRVTGTVFATLLQESVVSLDPVEQAIADTFSIEFQPQEDTRPQRLMDDAEDETPQVISFEEEGVEPIEDGHLGIGRLTCELLAVAMDPYPRKEGESFAYEAGDDRKALSPFAALQRLKSGQPEG